MNFATRIGLAANQGDIYRQKAMEQALLKQKLQQATQQTQQGDQQMRGSQLAGKLFPEMFNGAGGAAPQLPGGTQLPWTGGGSPPPVAGGLPGGGAPPMPGAAAGPTPPTMAGPTPPPGGAVPPAGGAPMQTNGLSWQQLAMAIKKQAPDADGATIMQVVQQYAPMMNQQSKMDVALMQMMVRDTIAQQNNATREDIADKNITGRKDVAGITQAGANNRNDKRLDASGGTDLKKAKTAVDVAKAEVLNLRNNAASADQIAAAQKKLEAAMAAYNGTGKKSGAAPALAPPDASALSATEEKSFDGGKTWWHLDASGKPTQSGG